MKKKSFYVIALLLCIVLFFGGLTHFTKKDHAPEDKLQITTSFFPLNIAVKNIINGVENVNLSMLSQPSSGCLHDYQLTTNDMKLLSNSDIVFFNGAGMEGYIDSVEISAPVYITTQNIELLDSSHEHDEHEEELHHDEDCYNSHAWVNPEKYILQIKNITSALIEFDPNNAEKYTENMNIYIDKIEKEIIALKNSFSNTSNSKVIIFHESMAYLCEFLDIEILHSVTIEGETTLSAGETAEIIEKCKSTDVVLLIGDNQYSDKLPSAISSETGIPYVMLDSCVNGELDNDSYIIAMKENINKLMEML